MSITRIHLPGVLSTTINGDIKLKIDPDLMQSYFHELLMGDPAISVEVCVIRLDAKKTNPQLAYFFAVVLPIIKQALEETEGTSLSKTDVLTILKSLFLYEEILFEGEFKKIPLSMAQAKKDEIRKFIQDVIDFGRDMLGVEIPEPQKQIEYAGK